MTLVSRWLVRGACAVLSLALFPLAAAAQTAGQQCSDIQMLQHKCGQQQSKPSSAEKPTDLFPNATRKQPKSTGVSASEGKTLNEGLQAANENDSATAEKDLQPIADSSKSPYAKALAMLGLAQVKYRNQDTKGAIALQKQALDSNALDNNAYFQGLETLAQLYLADEDYANALTTLDTFTKESGAQSAEVYALQGNAYYRLQKYPEAVAAIEKAKTLTTTPQASWDQIEMASYFAMDKYDEAAKLAEAALAKDPDNSALLQNVIAIYVNAHQDQKALALMERARANGQLKNADGYMNLARLYDNLAQTTDDETARSANAMKAVAVLKEGMSKGIIPSDFDGYKLLGDSYAIGNDYKNAVEAYGQASPTAKTGDVDFLRAQMLTQLGRNQQARDAAQQAITKGGFKRVGDAYIILGNAELALKHRAAAIAAYQQAAQDPDSRTAAQRMLKQLGQK